uniref:Endonuclease/exonuclease/phosphatase domain-containing protein n=1 Tax=Acanthochromis polyacanthus TaxID=80966 RepID=A0A3Q1G6Q9_9TELE
MRRGKSRHYFEQRYDHKDKGCFILVKGTINGNMYTFLSVYAPPGSDTSLLINIVNLIVNHSKGTLICGRDFNLHLHPNLDTSNQKSHNKSINIKFRKLINNIGLIDIWREMYPNTRQYTYFSKAHLKYHSPVPLKTPYFMLGEKA